MKIYSTYFSEDGLHLEVYTNAKALYNGIVKSGYEPKTIGFLDSKTRKFLDVKFSYANLVKAIRITNDDNKSYAHFSIEGENGNIHIAEHRIVSK